MDPITQTKIKFAKEALEHSGFKKFYNCYVDEKDVTIVLVSNKKVEVDDVADEIISNRFELLDL